MTGDGRSPSRAMTLFLMANTVIVQIVTYAYRPTLAYAALDAGGAPALLGVMSAIFAVPALCLAIPAGHLVDRTSERLLGLFGAGLMIVSIVVAILFPHTFIGLLVATLLFGVAHLSAIVAQQTLVANSAPRAGGDSAFGWYTLAASIGQAIGPLLLALPGSRAAVPPVELIFAICLGLAVIVGVTALAMPQRRRGRQEKAEPGAWKGAVRNVRQRGTLRALLASGIALASVDITLVYWPALGDERGIAPTLVSAMLVVRAVATMASRGLLGISIRRWGRRRVMIGTLGASALSLGVMAFPVPVDVLLLAAGVYGLGIGACQPITMAWLTSLAPAGRRGSMLALRLVGNRFAQSTIPAVAGLSAAALGSAGVVGLLAGALAFATWAGSIVPDAET